jgi:hypothetical protein
MIVSHIATLASIVGVIGGKVVLSCVVTSVEKVVCVLPDKDSEKSQ